MSFVADAPHIEPPEYWEESEEGLLSKQPLGDTEVMVEFDVSPLGLVCVQAAWINGERVDADCFAQRVISEWTLACEIEYASDQQLWSGDD